jgi:hypothetical protein
MKVHREVSGYSLFGGFLLFAHRKERNIYFIIVDLENRERERERKTGWEREERGGDRERQTEENVKIPAVWGSHIHKHPSHPHSRQREKLKGNEKRMNLITT